MVSIRIQRSTQCALSYLRVLVARKALHLRLQGLPQYKQVLRWLVGALCFAAAAAHATQFAYVADRFQKTVSVIDLATFSTTAIIAMEPVASSPVDVVANVATGTVWVAHTGGIAFIDAASNTVSGNLALAGIKALVVAPDGRKAFVLRSGSVSVVDAASKSVITTLTVDPSASSLAIDKDGDSVYLGHTGLSPNNTALGVAGITTIDALTNEVDSLIATGDFRPGHLAVNPGDDRLYMTGSTGLLPDKQSYRVFDPTSGTTTRVSLTVPLETPLILSLGAMAFNADGSRLYIGSNSFGGDTIPVLEIATLSGTVSRLLSLPIVLGDGHVVLKLATSFGGSRFVLAAFLTETAHHYPVEPRRRVVFMDVPGALFLNQFIMPNFGDGDFLIGDILDGVSPPSNVKLKSTTVLHASANSPLNRNLPVTFSAVVSGNQPDGNIVFKFVSRHGHNKMQKVQVALSGGMAALALPACTAQWDNRALRKIACGDEFKVVATYRGNALNTKSRSNPLYESR